MKTEIYGLTSEVVKKEVLSAIQKWVMSTQNGSKASIEEVITEHLIYIANRNLVNSLCKISNEINHFRGYEGARHRNLNNSDDYEGVSTFEIDDLQKDPRN